jgi:hypothetical protein
VIRNWPKERTIQFVRYGTQGRGTNIRIEINHTRLEIAGNYKLPGYKIKQEVKVQMFKKKSFSLLYFDDSNPKQILYFLINNKENINNSHMSTKQCHRKYPF